MKTEETTRQRPIWKTMTCILLSMFYFAMLAYPFGVSKDGYMVNQALIAGVIFFAISIPAWIINVKREFYGNKEFISAEQEFDAEKATVGAKVHKKLCKKCHSDGGSYADDDASILAGQWMPYLEQALADQVSGERTMLDEKMREKTDQLSEDDATSLIHFYGSQQ